MENVLFKISFPAEFHAQTAVEAAMTLHRQMQAAGKTAADIAGGEHPHARGLPAYYRQAGAIG